MASSGSQEIRFRLLLFVVVVSLSAFFLVFSTGYTFFFFLGRETELLRSVMENHFLAMTGLPMAAISATVLVALFRIAAGEMEFEAIGFKFRGAAAPAIIWIFAFLAFVGSMRLLWSVAP